MAQIRPYLALPIIIHPDDRSGIGLAAAIVDHFMQRKFTDLHEDLGILVYSSPRRHYDNDPPAEIDWEEAEIVIPIVMLSFEFASQPDWEQYLTTLFDQAPTHKSIAIPVETSGRASSIRLETQALSFKNGAGPDDSGTRQLLMELSHGIGQHLDARLATRGSSGSDLEANDSPMPKPVQVFLSYHKDAGGTEVATTVRDWLHANSSLLSFKDDFDLPPGYRFSEILLSQLKRSAILSIHTDTYSSRIWCRREVMLAKLLDRPQVVVDCLQAGDPRSIPYQNNTPIVRVSPTQFDDVNTVAQTLLDEVLKELLWRNRTATYRTQGWSAWFTFRPPELASLGRKHFTTATQFDMVYPGPRLPAHEVELFERITPNVQLLTLREWEEKLS